MNTQAKNSFSFWVCFLIALIYSGLRVIGGGRKEEAVASAVFLLGMLLLILNFNKIIKFKDYRNIFSSHLHPWQSLIISIIVGVVVVKNGRPLFLAALDVFFAFSFFAAFSSVVARFRKKL